MDMEININLKVFKIIVLETIASVHSTFGEVPSIPPYIDDLTDSGCVSNESWKQTMYPIISLKVIVHLSLKRVYPFGY